MEITAETRANHARLSEAAVDFLDFAAQHPECRRAETFSPFFEATAFHPYPLQPWPTFAGQELVEELEWLALGMDRLVKSLFDRLFQGDCRRIGEFYNVDPQMAELTFMAPDGIQPAITRLDCMLTAQGLRCIEVNSGSFVGGWNLTFAGREMLRTPIIARFLERQGLKARFRDSVKMTFRHIVDEALRLWAGRESELNVAVTVGPPGSSNAALHHPFLYRQGFSKALSEADPSLSGHCLVCHTGQLMQAGSGLYVQGRRIHALYEQHDSIRATAAFRCFKSGQLCLFTGPASLFLSDKRNLALLSEPSNQGLFDDEERRLIRKAVPWTRIVSQGKVRYRDQEASLPDLLIACRSGMVLKAAQSTGGEDVYVGRSTGSDEWAALIRAALQSGKWIVQEFLPSPPLCYQDGENGAAPHLLVLGLFAMGGAFGGAMLRSLPVGQSEVVNSKQGATESILLEVSPRS